jgi:hypothetical protein
VARPDSTLADIISEKAAKTYRPSDDLWLIVQCAHRISETVLPLGGVADLNRIPVQSVPFSRIYLLSVHGAFQWERSPGWTTLAPERKIEGPSFDDLKGYLANPELLTDPWGWFEREAKKAWRDTGGQ